MPGLLGDSARGGIFRFPPVFIGVLYFLAMTGWAQVDGRLFLPPYEDQAVGYWSEADFLAKNDFDYMKLRYEERHLLDGTGGSRSYTISILPTIVAILLEHTGSPARTAAIMRIVSFFGAAVSLGAVYQLASRRIGWLATLPTLGLAASPSFLVQAEIAGMDMPMTGAAALALGFLEAGFPVIAVGLTGVAFLFKPTAFVATFAMLIYLGLSSLLPGSLPDRIRARKAAIFAIGLLLVEGFLLAWSDIGAVSRTGYSLGQFATLAFAAFLTPEIGLLLIVGLIAGVIGSFHVIRMARHASRHDGRKTLELLGEQLRSAPAVSTAWLIVAGVTLAIGKSLFIPRYFTLAMPALYLVAGLTLLHGKKQMLGVVLFGGVIIFQIANMNGRFLPSTTTLAQSFQAIPARSCGFRERSLEYREYHESDVEAMKVISGLSNVIVFSQFPYTYYLDRPRLGYVPRRPEFISMQGGMAESYQAFRAEMQRQTQLGRSDLPVFIWLGDRRSAVPAPKEGDQILYHDKLESPLVIYMPMAAAERPLSMAAWENWYLGRLQQALTPIHQVQLLNAVGKYSGAEEIARALLKESPEQLDARLALAEALSRQGRYTDASLEADRAVDQAPDNPLVLLVSASVELINFDYEKARDRIREALRLQPNSLDANRLYGEILEKLGDRDGARDQYLRVLQLRPDDSETLNRLNRLQEKRP